METKIKKVLDEFLSDETENDFQEKIVEDKKKFIKSDNSIIERVDIQYVTSDGRQLLREVY